ncbi:MAG: hypothetical protein JRF38_09430 [Deltaproteobacteria bacterium]|nr:hypothetical protein [Deltaproteobacteria bacterium]
MGSREIGYPFGMLKKLGNEFSGAPMGKDLNWRGSLYRHLCFALYDLEKDNNSELLQEFG